MHLNPQHYRALLARQTEHFTEAEQDALTACLALARDMARHLNPEGDANWRLCVEALQLKLLTLIPDAPPVWVRVLIAKAAMEAPAAEADRIDAHSVLLHAAAGACARLAA